MDERKNVGYYGDINNIRGVRSSATNKTRYSQQGQPVKKRQVNGTAKSMPNYRAKSNMTKEQRRKLANQAKLRLAAFSLATGVLLGVGSTTLISTLARNYNSVAESKEATKQAIEIANEYDDFITDIEQNSQITSKEDVNGLKQLEDAIAKYTELKYKKDKTFNEEQEFLDVCRTICDSRMLVIDTYTDSIKNKLAEAFGIVDPKEIDSIDIHDYLNYNNGNGKYVHKREITLPDYTQIIEHPMSYSDDVKMPKELAENVTNARKLLDTRYNFDTMTTDELPVDEIIDTFQEALNFNNYKIVRDEKGNIYMEPIEQEQDAQQEQTNDEER